MENTESAEETDENTGKTIEELPETEVSEEAEVSEETDESTDDSDVNSEDNEDQQKSIESKEDLRKRVDKLLAKGDEAAARDILELMNNTDDWSYMYELPVDYPMPPRATLVRSAYKSAVYYVDKDDEYDFDLPYIWIIEDGEIIGQTLNNLDEIYEMGGFHEWWEYIENPPGAVHATGPDDE